MSVIGDWFSNIWQSISNWWNDTVRPFFGNLWNGLNNSYLDPSGFNAEQAQLDRDWQEQMMHFQNSYNSPEQQMQRARDAGLNPSLLYGQPIETSASPSGGAKASAMTGAFNPLDIFNTIQQKRLVDAQIKNIEANTFKQNAETHFQELKNKVEEQLQNMPVGHVITNTSDGQQRVDVVYGNYYLKLASADIDKCGLEIKNLTYQLADLYYNLALLSGSDIYPNSPNDMLPSQTPNFGTISSAFKGDWAVRSLTASITDLSYNAMKAEKAGKVAYSKFLEDNKDNPALNFFLAIRGYQESVQSNNFLPLRLLPFLFKR